jgi:hypothetical protein
MMTRLRASREVNELVDSTSSCQIQLETITSPMSIIVFPPSVKKPTFSGHETFPLRQLWLRKAHHEVTAHGSFAPKSVFADEQSIGRFGVGKNMVSSIRHWALACDVIVEDQQNDGYAIGEIGGVLFGEKACDPYLESNATLWLLHWMLAGRAKRSATWYVLFNFVQSQTFTQQEVIDLISVYGSDSKAVRSQSTLTNDVGVCLKCYTGVSTRSANEDLAEPLLTDLGLLVSNASGFHFHRGPQYSLPDHIFVFALLDFWQIWKLNQGFNQATLAFNSIAHDYGSPGRVFKLDEDSVGERLSKISELTRGALEWTDSSGLRQVSLVGKESIDVLKMRVLRAAYANAR